MVSISRHRKLLLLYFRYKDSAYYLGSFIFITLFVSILLILYVVVPQVSAFFSVNHEIENTRNRITVLKNNITYLSSLNTVTLNSDLQLAYEALPSDKDFAAIIDAINVAALDSGVEVNDYSVLIGELATPSAQLKQFYTVDLVLTIAGDKNGSKAFLQRMYQILPISQVKTFSLTEDGSAMKISFYFKPFPKGTYKVTEPIKEIPPNEAALVNTLSSWRNDAEPEGEAPATLSPDAAIGSPF